MKVNVQDGKFEAGMRKFKKKVQESNLLQELRDRETYTKPTTQRKMKANKARRRWKKHLSSQQLPKQLF
jgi:small subunit ribosomal protein S21